MARRRYRSVFAQQSSSGVGSALLRGLLLLIVLVVLGGMVVLGLWDVEPTTRMVEKPIPTERFLP